MSKQTSMKITYLAYLSSLILGLVVFLVLNQTYGIFLSTLIADVAMTLSVFAFSHRFNNSSIYDPYWSVIPIFIVLLWIVVLDVWSFYTVVLLIGVTIWGLRLTLNWYTDFEGYSHEDFRYVDFRLKFKKLYWLISFLGIHLFPTLIVLAAMYPLYYVLSNPTNHDVWILIGSLVMIGGAYISFVADSQRRLHKQSSNTSSIRSGLWKYSRHPNYFGEVLFWFGAYLTSLAIGLSFLTGIGFLGMVLLFNFYSVPKMEEKLLGNKEDYQIVIDRVPRFFFRKPKADE